MNQTEKMIAVAFDLNFQHATEIFSGAAEYVSTAGLEWRLLPLHFAFEERLMQLAESGELSGAIGTFVSQSWVAGLLQQEVAAVNLFQFSKIDSIPSLNVDNFQLGQQAAQHLQQQGARSFLFYGSDRVYYTQIRQAGYRASVPAEAYHELQPTQDLAQQLQALAQLPRPLGVLCSSDRLARKLIEQARELGLNCGQELLVLGIDNAAAESIFARIGISSFKLPAREIGYLACQHLHRILSGLPCPQLKMPQAELIPRESSLPSGAARLAQRAANWLQENLSQPGLEVAGLAHRLGSSRRSLELAFQVQFKTSPYRWLSQLRLAHSKLLLQTTRQPIMEVGRRCGYPEAQHFSAWFKKQTGCPPKQFRSKHSLAAKL
jgi:LacI family transcriptional regulator